jgi:hypothetical protein
MDNVHTITSDNGSEFVEDELIAKKLNANFCFAHSYSSWGRGMNRVYSTCAEQDKSKTKRKTEISKAIKNLLCNFDLICCICNLNLRERIISTMICCICRINVIFDVKNMPKNANKKIITGFIPLFLFTSLASDQKFGLICSDKPSTLLFDENQLFIGD